MYGGLEGKVRDDCGVDIDESHGRMVGENMTAAGFAPLAKTVRGFAIGADVILALRDFDGSGLPQ